MVYLSHFNRLELQDGLKETGNEVTKLTIDFDKTLILMLSGILSVCISLYNKNAITNCNEIYLFIITISLIAISILLGILKLNFKISSLKKQAMNLLDTIRSRRDGIEYEERNTFKLWKFQIKYILGKQFYICSILSLISLVTYAIIRAL